MRKIGKMSYDPKNIIGAGGFANVYEGLFEDVKRVAVKRFQKSGRDDDDESTIKREAELMLKANEHPNILRYFCHEVNDDFV